MGSVPLRLPAVAFASAASAQAGGGASVITDVPRRNGMTNFELIIIGVHVIIAGIFVIIYRTWVSRAEWPRQNRRSSPGAMLKASWPGLLVFALGAGIVIVALGL